MAGDRRWRDWRCPGKVEAGVDPCAAMARDIEIAPGAG